MDEPALSGAGAALLPPRGGRAGPGSGTDGALRGRAGGTARLLPGRRRRRAGRARAVAPAAGGVRTARPAAPASGSALALPAAAAGAAAGLALPAPGGADGLALPGTAGGRTELLCPLPRSAAGDAAPECQQPPKLPVARRRWGSASVLFGRMSRVTFLYAHWDETISVPPGTGGEVKH